MQLEASRKFGDAQLRLGFAEELEHGYRSLDRLDAPTAWGRHRAHTTLFGGRVLRDYRHSVATDATLSRLVKV
ncbi:hypothetical protein LBMAG38_11520 [Chloroflexota bacterium]|nr:hypothetical protein LBMAG38_11520 [Chloroflexota bacterium]